MTETVPCPNCHATFRLRDELRGRRLKCPKCGTSFTPPAPAVEGAGGVDPPPLPPRVMSHQGVTTTSDDWTPGRRLLRRTGIQCGVVGVLALILPLFGLQFTKLAKLGDAAWMAGAGLIVVGVVMVAFAYLPRRISGRAVLIAVVAVPGALLVLVALVYGLTLVIKSTRMSGPGSRGGAMPPPGVVRPAPGVPPSFVPSAPGGVRPTGPPSPAATQAAAAGLRASIVRQFGENRVVTIHVTGIDRPTTRGPLFRRVNELVRAAQSPPGAVRVSTLPSGGNFAEATFLVAPIDDLDAFARAVDFGDVSVDGTTRAINVVLDPSKLPATRPPQPASRPAR